MYLEAQDGTLVALSHVEGFTIRAGPSGALASANGTKDHELVAFMVSGHSAVLLRGARGVCEAVRERLIVALGVVIDGDVVRIARLMPPHPVLRPPLQDPDGGRRGD
jgi:hypothetical protein